MHRKCAECANKLDLLIDQLSEEKQNEPLSFFQWKRKSETRTIKGREKIVTCTEKAVLSTNVQGLLNDLKFLKMEPFLKHVYSVRYQYHAMKEKRETNKCNEMIIQIDFSENYVCKYREEAQAMHFGATKVQISLHTGVQYTFGVDGSMVGS